jgi:SAM-dependent methyltransferase
VLSDVLPTEGLFAKHVCIGVNWILGQWRATVHVEGLSNSLVRNSEGIYTSNGTHQVSYSEGGHDSCFQVEDRSFWFQHRNDCISSMVARYPYHGALLDIGGGNGYVAKRLADDGGDVVLLEPGWIGARNARHARGLEHVVCATVEEADFRPGSFGALGMFDVIEHVEDDRGFLEGVSELLGRGGKLYLTVPCHQWLWSAADVDAGHFRRHTEISLRNLLDGLFHIDYLTYFFRPLVLPQYLLRALPYRLGLFRQRGVLSTEGEHGAGNGLATRAVSHLLRREALKVAEGRRIDNGASCLVAATRL